MLHASSLGCTSWVNCWSAPQAGIPIVVGEGFRLFHGRLWRALACCWGSGCSIDRCSISLLAWWGLHEGGMQQFLAQEGA